MCLCVACIYSVQNKNNLRPFIDKKYRKASSESTWWKVLKNWWSVDLSTWVWDLLLGLWKHKASKANENNNHNPGHKPNNTGMIKYCSLGKNKLILFHKGEKPTSSSNMALTIWLKLGFKRRLVHWGEIIKCFSEV